MSINKVTIESLSPWFVTFFTLINYLESSFSFHLGNGQFIELKAYGPQKEILALCVNHQGNHKRVKYK